MTDEEKAAAALKEAEDKKQTQRESIKVTSNKEEIETEKKEETEVETVVETKEEKIEQHEKTEDELETEKLEAKTAAEKARVQKRIDKEVGKRKALEKEVEDLKKQLALKPDSDKLLTEDDVNKRAETLAETKAKQKDFDRACDKLLKDGIKADKTFETKVNTMAEEIGNIPGHMIGVLDDLDNGGDVLNYLTDNIDEAEEIYTLPIPKMALKLAKLSEKVAEAKKPPKKEISKVPDPSNPLKGGAPQSTVLTGKETMDDFVRKRAKQVEERRKARIGMH